jgi:tetratricopeptide (TPR) repeat protein
VAAATLLAPAASAVKKRIPPPPSLAAGRITEEPSPLEKLYHERAARNPQDVEAFEGMAILQVRRRAYANAIASYRRVLELTPRDHDAKVGLGRALAFDGQYDAALRNFQGLLQERPGDTDALEGLARVQMWAGHPAAALPIFQNLAAIYPANSEYAMGLARVEMTLHQYPQARKTLIALLAIQPRLAEARLQLATLDLFEGRLAQASQLFDLVMPGDPIDALKGKVRIAYYRGDLAYAYDWAEWITEENPNDVGNLLLLARIERALHRRRKAYALVHRAENLDTDNSEARDLEHSLDLDGQPTLHTAASFAREIGSGSSSSGEDLSAPGFETTWGMTAVPSSESSLSLYYLHAQSPSGGVQGAVGPSQILYRQTTYVTSQITVRGGFGLTRYGPGELAAIPTQRSPITSAGTRPFAFGSISYAPDTNSTVELTLARAAVTCTPTSVRLGVMEDRLSAGVAYRFDAKTDLRLEPFLTDDFSISYDHAASLVGSSPGPTSEVDHKRGGGASLTFSHKVIQKPSVAFDLGYSGLAYGFAGSPLRPYLGFFNPGFYQRHYLTARIVGKIWGPLTYDLSSGSGVQQIEHGTHLEPALFVSPAVTLKASSRLSLTLAYSYYDSAQTLGTVEGNAVRLSTDWRF